MRVQTGWVLLLCLLACGGCGKKEKSTDELIDDLKAPQEELRIIDAAITCIDSGDFATDAEVKAAFAKFHSG